MRLLRRLQWRPLLAGLAVGIVVGAGLTLTVTNAEEITLRLLRASYELRGWTNEETDRVLALRDTRHAFDDFEDHWPELRKYNTLDWLQCSYTEGDSGMPSSKVTIGGVLSYYTITVLYEDVCLPDDYPFGPLGGTY